MYKAVDGSGDKEIIQKVTDHQRDGDADQHYSKAITITGLDGHFCIPCQYCITICKQLLTPKGYNLERRTIKHHAQHPNLFSA
jgi:ferredoxin